MDRPHSNSDHSITTNHTLSSNHTLGNHTTPGGGRRYKNKKREDTPSKGGKKDTTPDGKNGYNRKRRDGDESMFGGRTKVTTPTNGTSNHGEGHMTNGNPSRHHYRDVPPRFQLLGTKSSSKSNSSSNKSNSKGKDNKTNKDSHWSPIEHTTVDGKWQNSTWISNPSSHDWTANDHSANSDPTNEENAVNKRDYGGCSDFDDLETDKPTIDSTHHSRYRNSDSDAMKDGVSSGPTNIVTDDSMDGLYSSDGCGLWRGHISRNSMGSSSSVNSAGSGSSSCRGGGSGGGSRTGSNNGVQRSASPRKYGRYDNHRNSITGKAKFPTKVKKPVVDLDDAIESLQSEPSGWGSLPSPKPTDIDTGTDVWGIPDDIKLKMSHDSNSSGPGWREGDIEWGNSKPCNWPADSVYSKAASTPNNNSGLNIWSSSDVSWNNGGAMHKDNRMSGFNNYHKTLMDLGFSAIESEEALKRSNNNLEASLTDLLTLATAREEDTPPGFRPHRLSPASQSSGGHSPRTTSPSFLVTSGSTPATPTIQPTQTHLAPVFHAQSSKVSRSLSVPVNSSIKTQSIQKLLTQQLREKQLEKQNLMNQLKTSQLSKRQQEFVTMSLNQVNSSIILCGQNLELTHQLSLQQQKNESDIMDTVRVSMSVVNTDLSPSDVFRVEGCSNNDIHNLTYSVSNVSLSNNPMTTTITSTPLTPTHSVSKLQQIISGTQESTSSETNYDNEYMSRPGGHVSVGVLSMSKYDERNHTSSAYSSVTQQQSTMPRQSTSSISSLTNSGKFSRSVDEIPEFKPGVPWNPGSQFNSGNKFSGKSDGGGPTVRPDSIPLGSTSGSDLTSFTDESEYYPSPSPSHYSRHIPVQHQYRRQVISPASLGPSRTVGSGYGNYSGTGSYYGNKQQGGQGFQPRPSSSTPSSQVFTPTHYGVSGNGSAPSRNNRQRLYSQQSFSGVGYGDLGGQRNGKSSDLGRKWSFDGNPWGVPEKSGTSIWSIDSSESLLSPSIGSEAFSPAAGNTNEWKAVQNRKPSLPVALNSPTNCILLKNVPPQVDEMSVRDVCSQFGMIIDCIFDVYSSRALVSYQTKDEALQAKLALEKSPIICGVNVQPSFASEKVMSSFAERRTPVHTYNPPASSSITDNSLQWLPSEPSSISPSTSRRSHITRPGYGTSANQDQYTKDATNPSWGSNYSAPGGPTISNSSGSSSVWSNGGILPGISTPWSTQSNPNTLSGTVADDSAPGTSPSLSTFLPNDLF